MRPRSVERSAVPIVDDRATEMGLGRRKRPARRSRQAALGRPAGPLGLRPYRSVARHAGQPHLPRIGLLARCRRTVRQLGAQGNGAQAAAGERVLVVPRHFPVGFNAERGGRGHRRRERRGTAGCDPAAAGSAFLDRRRVSLGCVGTVFNRVAMLGRKLTRTVAKHSP
jgi:hypothetical protein